MEEYLEGDKPEGSMAHGLFSYGQFSLLPIPRLLFLPAGSGFLVPLALCLLREQVAHCQRSCLRRASMIKRDEELSVTSAKLVCSDEYPR